MASQATAGAAEDGIVTPELMAILLGEGAANIPPSEEGVKKVTKSNSKPSTKVRHLVVFALGGTVKDCAHTFQSNLEQCFFSKIFTQSAE